MTIKEVEKLTGLTAKSIRYYEEKGLLTVERNEENSYRSYSENEVNRLKKIKLLRYLDFKVEEIKHILDMKVDDVEKVLQEKAENFSEQIDKCKDKQEICLTLAKDFKKNQKNQDKIIDEYNEAIEFLESDEMSEIEEELKEYATPSFSGTLLQTIICLGPISWLFINIHEGMLDRLMLNSILAILATILATWNWIHYFIERSKNKARIKKKNHQNLWLFPVIILAVVLGLAAVMVLFSTTERLLAPEGFLFYEHHPIVGKFLVWLVMIPVILLILLITAMLTKKSRKEMEQRSDLLFLWNVLGKFKWVAILVWLIAVYGCITSVTFVTKDTVVYHSPMKPLGIVYNYSDIEKINTGFGDSSFAFLEYKKKGSFYYQLEVDGKTIVFHQPTTNEEIERYTEDTYLELEEFDQRLVNLEIPKFGDSKGHENCYLDEWYIDRFVRITENK